jgi:hypothetical protein
MLGQKDIAEVYRLGLTIGLFTVEEVIAWSDSVVASAADPDFGLIEVSSAGKVSEGKMASLLREVGGESDPKTARRVIYGLLGRKLKEGASPDQIAAQAKAIQQGEGVHGEIGEDLAASLGAHDALAAEWLARR